MAGSLHTGSFIHRLLEAVGRELPPEAGFTRWSGLATMPPYAPGPVPGTAIELVRLVDQADGLLLTAPEHSLLPAELGHALRWLSAAGVLTGKHVAVMSASVRACGAMWAQAELCMQLTGAGAVVTGTELVLSPSCPHFDAQGSLTARYLRDQVRDVVDRLCPAPVVEPVRKPVREAVREPVREAVREPVLSA